MDATHALDPVCSYVANVKDPRRPHPTTFHSLAAIFILTILGTICGAQNWVEIELLGEAQQAWLSEFLGLPHGHPSHDTFGRIFALLDPESLHQAFVAWRRALVALCPESIAQEGTAMRRSRDRAEGKGPIHVVSAGASHKELVLAQKR
jgi:DDE_Tnp_1-associated